MSLCAVPSSSARFPVTLECQPNEIVTEYISFSSVLLTVALLFISNLRV